MSLENTSLPSNIDSHLSVLEKSQTWPGRYRFKFILLNESNQIETLKSYFDSFDHELYSNFSRSNKYISINVDAYMNSPQEVKDIYQKVQSLKGIIVL